MATFELKSGNNDVTIPIGESEAYITIKNGETGPFWGTITVESDRTTPLKMFIKDLEFGTVSNSQQTGYIDFGNNNNNENELWFSGSNSITNPPDKKPAIRVTSGTALKIISSATISELTCRGGSYGAGIGGGLGCSGENITICGSGIITAYGGILSAGIGGGFNGSGGNITITGSVNITAYGGDWGGAGIGSGTGGFCGNITISSSGTIIAYGGTDFYNGDGGAGIGSGSGGLGGSITITGSSSITAYGGSCGAGIGGGTFSSGGNITITSSGTITAYGGHWGAGIGSGGWCHIPDGKIIIVGWGIIKAIGGGGVEDIGKGYAWYTDNSNRILANPFLNITSPALRKIEFMLENTPYSNGALSLVIVLDNPQIYNTKTDVNGTIYFYADKGTFSFESPNVHYDLSCNSFTLPPLSNVPTQLFLKESQQKFRGINFFV